MDELNIEGWEGLVEALPMALRPRYGAGYVSLHDRTDRHTEVQVGRLELSPEEVGDWLDEEAEWSGEPQQVSQGVLAWARRTIAGLMTGESLTRFRLKVWSVKANKLLYAHALVARNPEQEAEERRGGGGLPLMAVERAFQAEGNSPGGLFAVERDEAAPSPTSRRQLIVDYVSWELLQIVLGATREITTISQGGMKQAYGQLNEARKANNDLVAAVLQMRVQQISELEAEYQARKRTLVGGERSRQVAETQGLIKQVLGVMLTGSAGVPPELVELAGNPELRNLLTDAEVQQMLKDPEVVAQMGPLIRAQAAQYAAAHSPGPAAPMEDIA